MTNDDSMTFRAPTKQAERFRRAAELEGMTVSEWLRRLALLRVAELADRLEAVGK
jgi:hypothetical protein